MNGGSKFLASAAVLALAGCGGSQAKLQIRPTPAPLSATAKPVPFRIAEANGHLALGNVALAVESYRKALREQPDSVEAMVGLAASYDHMTRFDLSRRYYEAALAVVPADTGVLAAFARSLEVQGRSEEASAVRREIGVRLAAAKPSPRPAMQAPVRQALVAQVPVPVAGPSVTVALPAPKPIATASAKAPVVPVKSTPVRQVLAAPGLSPKPIATASVEAPVVTGKTTPARQVLAAPAPALAGPSVTVALPAPKPIATASVALPVVPQTPAGVATPEAPAAAPAAAASPAPTPIVVPSKRVEPIAAPLPPAPAPVAVARATVKPLPSLKAPARLERMSLGEVALVTTGRPQWRSQVVGRTAQSTTIRYVPLRTAQTRLVQIRLLNAARHQGLAARTRSLLAYRGWRQLGIGDSTRVRRTSLILYPPNRRATAERLAAQFGFPIARRASGNEFVMLLGRDAAKYTGARTGG